VDSRVHLCLAPGGPQFVIRLLTLCYREPRLRVCLAQEQGSECSEVDIHIMISRKSVDGEATELNFEWSDSLMLVDACIHLFMHFFVVMGLCIYLSVCLISYACSFQHRSSLRCAFGIWSVINAVDTK
jgi:hypothetical protein